MLAAYVGSRGLADVTEWDARTLDIINIAFGTIKDGLVFFPEAENRAKDLERIRSFNPDIKILVSIGGWGAGGFSTMSKKAETRKAFVDSVLELSDVLSLDGIDIDWEYPRSGSAGIDYATEDRENFTFLLSDLRDGLEAHYAEHKMLTIAAGAGEYFIEDTEIPKIAKILDYISIMTYDMAGTWTPAQHHTALYSGKHNRNSADFMVKLYESAGVPADHLMIGAAFYSRIWTDIPSGDSHGLGNACDNPDNKNSGTFGPGAGDLFDNYIRDDGTVIDGWTLYRDEDAHARWIYNEAERKLISFDDPESVYEKVKFADKAGLVGVMYWEHGCDRPRRLLKSMARAKAELLAK